MRGTKRVNPLTGMLIFPNMTPSLFKVFKRNFAMFKKNFLGSLFYFCIEPVVFYLVIGFGLSQYIGQVNGQMYFDFLIPGYLCFVAFNASFLNASFGTLIKQKNAGLYSSLKLTPIKREDMAVGELLFSAFKGLLGAFSVYFIYIILTQKVQMIDLMFLFIISLVGWVGACMGLITTTFGRQENLVMKVYSFYILPTSLIFNVFFPTEGLPHLLKIAGLLSPVSHAATINHLLVGAGVKSYTLYLHIAILFAFVLLLTNLAVQRFKTKL